MIYTTFTGAITVPARHHTLTEEQLQEIGGRFANGDKLKTLASENDIQPGNLYQLLLRRNLQARRTGGTVSLVSDVNCFSDPFNNPTAAYFVGLLMADGSISKRGCVSFGVKESDGAVVHALNEFLGGKYAVSLRRPSAGKYGSSSTVRISFQCTKVAEDLKKWGVSQRKTETAEVLGGVNRLAAFWRGMVDGDGYVSNPRGCPRISLCGTQRVCEQFATFVRLHSPQWKGDVANTSHRFLKTVTAGGKSALPIAKALYTPGCIAIPRKAAVAFAWFAQS